MNRQDSSIVWRSLLYSVYPFNVTLPKTLSQKNPNIYIHVFIKFELVTIISSKYVLFPYLSVFHFGTSTVCALVRLMVSHRFLRFTFLQSFPFCSLGLIISIFPFFMFADSFFCLFKSGFEYL